MFGFSVDSLNLLFKQAYPNEYISPTEQTTKRKRRREEKLARYLV
jgi:hypothetical protein